MGIKVSDYLKSVTKDGKVDIELINKSIITDYISFDEKLVKAEKIAKLSTHKKIGDKEVFKSNSVIKVMFTHLQLIDFYTDIDVDFSSEQYDELLKTNLLPLIFSSIPESEINIFNGLVDMCISDIYTNEHDIVSLLENKQIAIENVANVIIDTIEQIVGGSIEKEE